VVLTNKTVMTREFYNCVVAHQRKLLDESQTALLMTAQYHEALGGRVRDLGIWALEHCEPEEIARIQQSIDAWQPSPAVNQELFAQGADPADSDDERDDLAAGDALLEEEEPPAVVARECTHC
jgi:hypothetical protein